MFGLKSGSGKATEALLQIGEMIGENRFRHQDVRQAVVRDQVLKLSLSQQAFPALLEGIQRRTRNILP